MRTTEVREGHLPSDVTRVKSPLSYGCVQYLIQPFIAVDFDREKTPSDLKRRGAATNSN